MAVSFIDRGNRSTWRNRKSLTHFIKMLYGVHLAMSEIRTRNFSDDRHWLHR